jgi:hypothetical protein
MRTGHVETGAMFGLANFSPCEELGRKRAAGRVVFSAMIFFKGIPLKVPCIPPKQYAALVHVIPTFRGLQFFSKTERDLTGFVQVDFVSLVPTTRKKEIFSTLTLIWRCPWLRGCLKMTSYSCSGF